MGLVRPIFLTALACLALAGCSVETSSTEALNPDNATVQAFLDGSIPVEDDTAEAFFAKHTKECPNVDLSSHISSDFLDEIRTKALGADGTDQISTVLYTFCTNAP